MQTQSVRTTIDIDAQLARRLKEFSARHGLTQKRVITNAIKSYMTNIATESDANALWKELRKLAQKGKKNFNLTYELRKDRDR